MSISIGYVTFDCHDPRALAEFWATALAYEIDSPNEDAGEILLNDPTGKGASLGFMKVPESKVVKNRVHLDVIVTDTPLEEEVQRLVAAGATVVEGRTDPEEGYIDPAAWFVMQDPDGNEFCVLQPVSRA